MTSDYHIAQCKGNVVWFMAMHSMVIATKLIVITWKFFLGNHVNIEGRFAFLIKRA